MVGPLWFTLVNFVSSLADRSLYANKMLLRSCERMPVLLSTFLCVHGKDQLVIRYVRLTVTSPGQGQVHVF